MEVRLRPILLILLLATAMATAAIGLSRLGIDPLAFVRPATPTTQAAVTKPLVGQRITFADDSAAWDWQAAWVRQSPNPRVRTIRVTLTDESNLGVSTVGVGYPNGEDQAAIVYAACNDEPDLVCQVTVKQGAPGDDLNVAVTAAIPHAIRNAWLIHASGRVRAVSDRPAGLGHHHHL